jgi:hypothetical protein
MIILGPRWLKEHKNALGAVWDERHLDSQLIHRIRGELFANYLSDLKAARLKFVA